MRKVLYYKEYESSTFWGMSKEENTVSYVKIEMHFDFKEWLRFSASTPNVGFCCRNPIKALLRLLEHESIGMAKYNRLKERIEDLGIRKRL